MCELYNQISTGMSLNAMNHTHTHFMHVDVPLNLWKLRSNPTSQTQMPPKYLTNGHTIRRWVLGTVDTITVWSDKIEKAY